MHLSPIYPPISHLGLSSMTAAGVPATVNATWTTNVLLLTLSPQTMNFKGISPRVTASLHFIYRARASQAAMSVKPLQMHRNYVKSCHTRLKIQHVQHKKCTSRINITYTNNIKNLYIIYKMVDGLLMNSALYYCHI